MFNESSIIYDQLAKMPDSNLKALLLPDQERDNAILERIKRYIDEAKFNSETANNTFAEIETEQNRITNSKQVILNELQQADQSVEKQLELRRSFAETLKRDKEIPDSQEFSTEIAEDLLNYVNHCSERQRQIVSRIQRDIRKKNFLRARTILGEFITDLESVDLQWKDILSSSELPQEIIDNVDLIINSVKLRNCLQIIDRNKKTLSKSKDLLSIRAKSFAPLIEQGYAPDIILDLIEGRYDMDDPVWSGNLAQSYLPVDEFIQKNSSRSKTPIRTRLILTGLTAMLASGFLLGGSTPIPSQIDPEYGRRNTPLNLPGHGEQLFESSGGQGSDRDGLDKSDGQDSTGEGNSEKDNNGQGKAEGPPSTQDEYSPENSGELDKNIYWQIEGQVPEGNFRESISNEFIWSQWQIDTGESNQLYYINISNTPIDSPTKLISIFPVSMAGQRFTIPVPDNWEITYVQVGSETQRVINISRSNSGSYVAELAANLDAPQTLTVGLRPIESGTDYWENAPNPDYSDRETIQTEYLIGDAEKIDKETISFLNEIRDNGLLNTQEKSEIITNFVKDHFIYSLDRDYSNFYLEDRNSGEYVARAWQVGYGDCDVVNTVNVAFLRYVGIDARLATGFANSSDLLSANRRILEGSELHGWAQFFNFDTKNWEDADATPGVVDSGSLDQLMNLNNGAGIKEIFSIKSIKDLLKTMGLMMAKTANFATSELGIVSQILSVLSIYGLLYGAGSRIQSKNRIELHAISSPLPLEKDSPDWKPHNQLSDKISEIVRAIIRSQSNYLGFEPHFFEKVLLFPRLIKAKKDRKLVRSVVRKSNTNDTQDTNFDPALESIPGFISRVVGISPDLVSAHTRKEHLAFSLSNLETQFKTSANAAFSKSLLHDKKSKGVSVYIISLGAKYKEHPLSEAMFINSIMEQLYKQYLVVLKKANIKRARNVKRGVSAYENRDTIRPTDNPIRISMTPKPISKIDFIKALAPEIPLLLKYHELSNYIRKKVEEKKTGKKS